MRLLFNGHAFSKKHKGCKEYVGTGIERAYAVRLPQDEMPSLVLCRSDGSYVTLNLWGRKLLATTHSAANDVWQNVPVLQNTKYIGMAVYKSERNKCKRGKRDTGSLLSFFDY